MGVGVFQLWLASNHINFLFASQIWVFLHKSKIYTMTGWLTCIYEWWQWVKTSLIYFRIDSGRLTYFRVLLDLNSLYNHFFFLENLVQILHKNVVGSKVSCHRCMENIFFKTFSEVELTCHTVFWKSSWNNWFSRAVEVGRGLCSVPVPVTANCYLPAGRCSLTTPQSSVQEPSLSKFSKPFTFESYLSSFDPHSQYLRACGHR